MLCAPKNSGLALAEGGRDRGVGNWGREALGWDLKVAVRDARRVVAATVKMGEGLGWRASVAIGGGTGY